MKKIFVLAAVAAVVFASCTKETFVSSEKENLAEMSISAFNKVATKNYTGWDTNRTFFYGVENPDTAGLNGAKPDTTVRTMKLSVFQETVNEDLFTDVTFAKGTDPDTVWHATPAIYYPLGGNEFDFLAYSVGTEANYIGVWDGAKKVTLQVTNKFFQDDIVYAAAKNKAQAAPTAMNFSHAQAWICMNLSLAKESTPTVDFKVNSITWKNVKSEGKLSIEYGATAKATWDFFGIDVNEVNMDDPHDKLDDYLAKPEEVTPATNPKTYKDGKPSQLNMLLPAQTGAKSFVINYTVGGKTYDYEYTLTSADWEMGHKYIYNVKVTVCEITIYPTVVEFVVETPVNINF